jgi:hypothetical protein
MRDKREQHPLSRESKPELPIVHAPEMNAASASEGSAPETGVSPAVARFGQGNKKELLNIRSKPECA